MWLMIPFDFLCLLLDVVLHIDHLIAIAISKLLSSSKQKAVDAFKIKTRGVKVKSEI